ncbi:hypothetical protein ADU59_12600 [Pararhizobium polonicum]|uniref:TRASH domain-containing protein n=2 Tax=Pararhizobium polonicum TaxID=1612624 RepID=A0A1C7P6T9_9HYPH|nr:hypothetical protein ADU59_12600 [Pararhizobium polonicum]
MVFSSGRNEPNGGKIMQENTCAACDCELDASRIAVKIGGKTVEVCCEECAQALREADAAIHVTQVSKG